MPSQSSSQSERINVGIKDPVRLHVEPVGFDGKMALVAVGADGSRLTILASRERFQDAFFPRGLQGVLSEAEQVREMFIRDEVDVLELEKSIEREMGR